MSVIPKGKLSYASLGKTKKSKQEETVFLGRKENDSIYDTILSGMNGTQKDYISHLIKAKRRKEQPSVISRNASDQEIDLNAKPNKQTSLRMNSSKLKHVQSMDEAQFLQDRSGCKYRSTNASIIINQKAKGRVQQNEGFIGSLDGYINRLQSNDEIPKAKIDDQDRDYENKYKRLAQIYMQQINSSKQKQQKLIGHIKKLKKYVQQLQIKVASKEQQEKSFMTLWKRREDQLNILLGVEQQLKDHVYSNDLHFHKKDDEHDLQLESYDEVSDLNNRKTLKFNPEERRTKSRHTVNYY